MADADKGFAIIVQAIHSPDTIGQDNVDDCRIMGIECADAEQIVEDGRYDKITVLQGIVLPVSLDQTVQGRKRTE